MASRAAKPTRTVAHAGKEDDEGQGEKERGGCHLTVFLSLSPLHFIRPPARQQGQTANGEKNGKRGKKRLTKQTATGKATRASPPALTVFVFPKSTGTGTNTNNPPTPTLTHPPKSG